MNKALKTILSVSLFAIFTFGCSSGNSPVMLLPDSPSQINSVPKEDTITIKVKLDTPAFISESTGELSGVALMDDGKIFKYQTIKVGTSSVKVTTIVYESKWVKLESHPTTASEAETILKLVRQGGFSKEYKTLSDRYSEAGLVR